MKNNVRWSGDFFTSDYYVVFEAAGTWYHTPGCMYRSNGDPGDPPVDEYNVESIELKEVYQSDEHGDETVDIANKLSQNIKESLEELIEDAIYNDEYTPEVLDDYPDPDDDDDWDDTWEDWDDGDDPDAELDIDE